MSTLRKIMESASERAGCLSSPDGNRFTVTLDQGSAEALDIAPTLRLQLVARGWLVHYHDADDREPKVATWHDAGPGFGAVIREHVHVRSAPAMAALALVMNDKDGRAARLIISSVPELGPSPLATPTMPLVPWEGDWFRVLPMTASAARRHVPGRATTGSYFVLSTEGETLEADKASAVLALIEAKVELNRRVSELRLPPTRIGSVRFIIGIAQ